MTLPVTTPPPAPPSPARVLAHRALAAGAGLAIIGFARALTGVRALLAPGASLQARPTLYFANHASHGDFVLLWASLPPGLRAATRPVAGEDYWLASRLRRFIGHDVFRALMIRRQPADGGAHAEGNPVAQMAEALDHGHSLIMFPEGTRNTTDEVLLPLKSGLYHLARQCPEARLVPVWIDNLKRVLPKGELLPVPLACSVCFGAPLALQAGEGKADFLQRAREAMLALRPAHAWQDDAPAAPPAITPQAAP
ncbi:MAG: lysophospholipid acyltransferase family protein [Pseudomonadota bacterium]|nr:lysophospholipid acyltransferase family protein [Pseudomonadota bacterium]